MKIWKTRELTRACLFSALLALLMGCNDDNGDPKTDSTFPEVKTTVIDDTKVPNEPVVGDVKEVPGTKPKLVTSDPRGPGQTIVTQGETVTYEPAKRFIEVAPDTASGETSESSPTYDYDLGSLVAMHSDDSAGFTGGKVIISPIKGWIRYPVKELNIPPTTRRYPIIMFLHGQHTDTATEHSYQGYNYLAEDLVPHGYVVLSIDANVINIPRDDNPSGQSRAQLVLGTLDRLRQINENGQVDKDGKPGPLDALKGKLDFDRIGAMGHSRGGQGISVAMTFNETRSGVTEPDLRAALIARPSNFQRDYPDLAAATIRGSLDETKFKAAMIKYNIYYAAGSGNENVPPPYNFKGAFLLAQTDFGVINGLSDVPIATLLPSCDGDMRNLQGSATYDRNRFGRSDYTAPRYQVFVNGTNHNDYNTHWPRDDFSSGRGPGYCLKSNPDSIRLSPEDQRRGGTFIINSFMRYHVGGEQKFASWWNGLAQLPEQACPFGKGTCDERVVLTVQKPETGRKLIQRFEWADSLRRNLVGGGMSFSGFEAVARCSTPSVADTPGNCAPKRLPGFEYFNWDGGQGFLSIADQAQLAWSKPNASIVSDLKDLSAKGYDSLTFRIAVVRPMGQEVLVTLTDTAGKLATVTASNFSDALYNAPRRKTYPVKEVPVADASIGLPDPAKGISTMVDLIGRQATFEVPSAVALVAQPEPDPAKDIPFLDHKADAPYANGQVKMLMNMVAIPLQAFEGVDLDHLKELKLAFPKESGKVAITDIELQNFGRAERLAEIALSQAGMLGGTGGGIALGGNGGPPKSASGKPGDKMLIVNH